MKTLLWVVIEVISLFVSLVIAAHLYIRHKVIQVHGRHIWEEWRPGRRRR